MLYLVISILRFFTNVKFCGRHLFYVSFWYILCNIFYFSFSLFDFLFSMATTCLSSHKGSSKAIAKKNHSIPSLRVSLSDYNVSPDKKDKAKRLVLYSYIKFFSFLTFQIFLVPKKPVF